MNMFRSNVWFRRGVCLQLHHYSPSAFMFGVAFVCSFHRMLDVVSMRVRFLCGLHLRVPYYCALYIGDVCHMMAFFIRGVT